MKYIKYLANGMEVSQVALGCMRIGGLDDTQVDRYINTAYELGYNYFDHADIYGRGQCEEVFGRALKRNPQLRDKIVIQTKCGIGKGMYDFSTGHIISAVEGSLKRLGVDTVDVLLLHRPDLLMEPDQVSAAFDSLQTSGKVKEFGVSNHSPLQIELLKQSVRQKLIINQVQLSLAKAQLISGGANVNVDNADGVNRDGYLRDYCRLQGITLQPWSPLQHGFIEGAFLGNEKFSGLNAALTEISAEYGITETGLAIAWLLRLPEKMQPVVGSTNPERLKQIAVASDIVLSAQDWYKLYIAAGYKLP